MSDEDARSPGETKVALALTDDEEVKDDNAREPGETKDETDEELERVCGSGQIADLARKLWREMEDRKSLDASGQRLTDDDVRKLMNGLHTIARQTGYLTERMRPFPCEKINFSGNPMTRVGAGEIVQFARTHGCNAKSVDLSHCDLDDVAATEELSRLVKNSGTWRGASSFLTKLSLRGNRIGRSGASKLVQYAHWARVGYASAAPKEEEMPPVFELDLSGNVIDRPRELAEELTGKKIKVSTASEPEADATVHLPDFEDQRDAPPEPPPRRAIGGGGGGRAEPARARGGREERREEPRRAMGGASFGAGECWDFRQGKCFRGNACKFHHEGGGGGGRRDERDRYDRGRDARRYSRSRSRDRRDDRRGGDRRSSDRDRRGGRRDDSPPPRRARSDSRDRGRARSPSRDRRRSRSPPPRSPRRSDSRDRRSASSDRKGRSSRYRDDDSGDDR